jgi:hypothetical protein
MRRTSATLVLLSLVGCGGAPAAVPDGGIDAASFDAMLADAAAPDATPFDPCGGGGPIEVRGNPESTITMTALTCTPEASFCEEEVSAYVYPSCDGSPQIRLEGRTGHSWYGFVLETDQGGNIIGASGAVYSTQDHYAPGEGPGFAPVSGWIQFQSIDLCSLAGALEITYLQRVVAGTFHVDSNPQKPAGCP